MSAAQQYALPLWKQAIIHAAARKAKITQCADCGAIILTGLDDDICAHPAAADPRPLTWAGELGAHLLHTRRTYELSAGELHRRTESRRRAPPPFGPPIAAHICGQPLPDHWYAPPTQRKDTTHDECPY